MTTRKRATSITEFNELIAKAFEDVKVEAGLKSFSLRPTDVVITPFAKSGTTWLQQIVHTLRTRGDMDFDDISRVVPWLEMSHVLGVDLEAPQRGEPRAFKSHLSYDEVPKGGRYINSVRNPKDVAYSEYKFMEGWFIEPGTIGADEFVTAYFLPSNAYYDHLKSWWAHKDDEKVLFLAYEHMKADLNGTIERVARFIGIELDPELAALTREHASLDYMLAHRDRFDDALIRAMTEREILPPGSDSAKVRAGQVGEHAKDLSAAVVARLDAKWREEITPALGFDDYEALLHALN